MKTNILKCGALLIAILAPIAAHSQGLVGGTANGASNGADNGNRAAGPVGGVVGGVTGGVDGLLGIDQRPRFHKYVVNEHRKSYHYDQDVRDGTILPSDGVEYYDVPPEYGATRYHYAVINNQTVLVDPQTHTIVQIIQ